MYICVYVESLCFGHNIMSIWWHNTFFLKLPSFWTLKYVFSMNCLWWWINICAGLSRGAVCKQSHTVRCYIFSWRFISIYFHLSFSYLAVIEEHSISIIDCSLSIKELLKCLIFHSPTAGRRFYAHRICLLASSDAFRAMFDGGYRVGICI